MKKHTVICQQVDWDCTHPISDVYDFTPCPHATPHEPKRELHTVKIGFDQYGGVEDVTSWMPCTQWWHCRRHNSKPAVRCVRVKGK